jgi:hypothetical protein
VQPAFCGCSFTPAAPPAQVDDLIGDVIATCEELGVADNTFFFYSSDHGFQLGEFNIAMDKRNVYLLLHERFWLYSNKCDSMRRLTGCAGCLRVWGLQVRLEHSHSPARARTWNQGRDQLGPARYAGTAVRTVPYYTWGHHLSHACYLVHLPTKLLQLELCPLAAPLSDGASSPGLTQTRWRHIIWRCRSISLLPS